MYSLKHVNTHTHTGETRLMHHLHEIMTRTYGVSCAGSGLTEAQFKASYLIKTVCFMDASVKVLRHTGAGP